MIHIVIREAETGRFFTHFKYPLDKWQLFVAVAAIKNLTVEEAFIQAITEYAEQVLGPGGKDSVG
jgi:hypothetical protein